jgi:thioredoxin
VERDGTLVIDWWAPWCGPCRAFGPIYDKASENHTGVTFGKINTEEQPDLAGAFQIQAIPTLMVFRDRVLVFANPGMISGAVLDDLLGKVQALDMADVRKRIAEQEAADAAEGDGADEARAATDNASTSATDGAPDVKTEARTEARTETK